MSGFTSPPSCSDIVSGSAKFNEVTKILDILSEDLRDGSLSQNQQDAYLEKLKIYGRDPSNSDPIYTEKGIRILAEFAFKGSSASSRNASRCLANAMLLVSETRQIFVDLGFQEDACKRLSSNNRDDQFLMSRILFLTTYNTNIDLEKLIIKHNLAENICDNINKYANHIGSETSESVMESGEEMALIETLKLLFNVTHFCPQEIKKFSPVLKDLLILLTRWPIIKPRCLDPPVAPLINAIINLDLGTNYNTLFPLSKPNFFADHCVKLLDRSTETYSENELEQNLTPLIVLLRKINEIAPPETQAFLQNLLLPSIKDREQVLGRTKTLPSRLLKLSSNSLIQQLRESISALLFELSGRDAKKFVRNVGYGFASGFLYNHNLPISKESLENLSDDEENMMEDLSAKVNPVTGQLLEKEEKVGLEDMTEEEREREAEKLFVLFERLEKNGIISVKNPAKNVQELQRFEELADNADSD